MLTMSVPVKPYQTIAVVRRRTPEIQRSRLDTGTTQALNEHAYLSTSVITGVAYFSVISSE